uniref:MAPK regulated corepressor interacting protein 1 n=2 Tax=Anolis carolinensis TaxID=28377 RepID=G1KKC4_ANOCA|nr:PREDICTED: mapk-regulated corepressor-interacting protein 1 [Anolis carolinensis]|eukprot:XP_008102803.1 PREDICTED: mapk-regulated corepressor-interacting protein 1 [Anolis carolinensis]
MGPGCAGSRPYSGWCWDPSFLPSSLPSFLPSFLPSSLPSSLPSFPSSLPWAPVLGLRGWRGATPHARPCLPFPWPPLFLPLLPPRPARPPRFHGNAFPRVHGAGVPEPIRPQCARAARPRRALFRPGPGSSERSRDRDLDQAPDPAQHHTPCISSAWGEAIQDTAMTSSPVSRVVYNGKRNSSPRSPSNSSEIFTPAHEENVRFIYEAWQCVERDLRNQMAGGERGLVEEYVEKMPNPSLKAFKPVDLSDLKRRNTQDAKKS